MIIYLTDNKDWMDYISPLTLLSAVGLVAAFSKIRPDRTKGIIRLLSPTVLAVFVIHVHTIPWKHITWSLPSGLKLWQTDSLLLLAAGMLLWSLFVYAVCTMLDLLRIGLFNRLGIPEKLKAADAWLESRRKRLLKR